MMLSPLSGVSPRSRLLVKLMLATATTAFAAWSWLAHGGMSSPTFDVDTYDYAQMSRQLYRGEGFTMQQTFPYVVRWLGERGIATSPPWPNTTRFPLIAVAEAAAFAVMGPNDRGILLAGGAMFALTAGVAFLLGCRLFGPLAGVLAAVCFAVEPLQLQFSRSGLLETGAGLLFASSALLLVAATRVGQARRSSCFALGVSLGLAFLQRYDLLAIAPVAVLLLIVRRDDDRSRAVLWCSAGFLAAAGPWLLRNLTTIGTLLGSTSVDRNLLGGVLPGDVYLGTQTVSAWSYALEHWRDFAVKFETAQFWFSVHYRTLFGGAATMLAAMLAFLVAPLAGGRATRTAWMFLVGAFVSRAVLLSLMHNEPRFYLSFAPVLLALGIGGIVTVFRRISFVRPALPVLGAVAIGAAAWSVPRVVPEAISGETPPALAAIRERIVPGTIVASDQSWLVAWYVDRPSVRFGARWAELKELESAGVTAGAVMLSRRAARDFLAADGALAASAFTRVEGIPDDYVVWLRKNNEPLP